MIINIYVNSKGIIRYFPSENKKYIMQSEEKITIYKKDVEINLSIIHFLESESQ